MKSSLEWCMRPYISYGNRKVGKIPTFSLPAVVTCPGATPLCKKICYARKAERAWPNVLASRLRNFMISTEEEFTQLMINEIRRRKSVKYFRIHESGDFYDQLYLEKWFNIARALPNVKFLAFTKSFHLDFSKRPSNLIIYYSVMPDTTMEVPDDGPRAYLMCGPENIHVCYGKCDECLFCWEVQKDVRMKKH